MDKLCRSISDVLYASKSLIGRQPFLGTILLASDPRLAKRSSEIVIEGFPRSGNSSTVERFRMAQSRNVKIAHHLHHPLQVKLAKKFDTPCLILFREPEEAVISLKVLGCEWFLRSGKGAQEMHASFGALYKSWYDYYSAVIKSHEHVVLADLETSKRNLDEIICVINKRWQKSFISETGDLDPRQRGWHAMPSDVRKPLQQLARQALRQDIERDVNLRRRIEKCQSLYEQLLRLRDIRPD